MSRMAPNNLILRTDSYKLSHHSLYPDGTTGLYSYLESRGGKFPETVFFGLQYLMKEYLAGWVVPGHHIREAEKFAKAHGVPFPAEEWRYISEELKGNLPIRIKAVPEGTVVPTSNVLLTVESTDPKVFWLASWLETIILRGLWYPITVATQSYHIKKNILAALQESSDNPEAEIPFKLHDFGARGVSSAESAGIGGMAHLVNFQGSDTIEGILFANAFYEAEMAGYSIPASEHSVCCSGGPEGELDVFRNMLKQYGQSGKMFACVSDSYDFFKAVEQYWATDLLEEVKASGCTVVIRPDSGNPKEIIMQALRLLKEKVGMTQNSKGYWVLPSYFRLIQGDGVNIDSIKEILEAMLAEKFSATNLAFGSGGALLQKVNRDTLRFAYKCSEITVNGESREVFKDPVTDPGKLSKKGRLSLIKDADGKFQTVSGDNAEGNLLETVFENGKILKEYTFEEVRARAKC